MRIKNLFKTNKTDRAVSPVIGVILMVAITVILAAVIGTFVLGLGDSVESDVQAGVSVTQEADGNSGGGSIVVTYTSQGTSDGIAVVGNGDEPGSADGDNLYTQSVGGVVEISTNNADIDDGDISQGDSLSIVAYEDADLSGSDTLNNVERKTVIRTVEADFDISSP